MRDDNSKLDTSKRQFKDFKFDEKALESLGVIPFTLRKDTLKGKHVIAWTTTPRFFAGEGMEDSKQRIEYVFGNAEKTGLDEMVMPDQIKDGEVCHEITYDEILAYYQTDLARKEGTLWNVPKKYDSVFMTRETHFRVMEDLGRSISLVFPAADCAIVRLYDREKDVIGLTHSDISRTSRNIVGDMVKYMKEHFGSKPENIIVFVGAFARDGMIWDKYPPFAQENHEVWGKYIEKIDDTHYNIKYGDRLYDQLLEDGLSRENIYFDPDNTVKNDNYFSNNRSKLLGEKEGRNLFGITFDSLPVFENTEGDEVRTRLK